jgi:large subunit ribosomal protein L22
MAEKKKTTTKKVRKKEQKSPTAPKAGAKAKKGAETKAAETASSAGTGKKGQAKGTETVSALYKNAQSSPQKARLVADLIRGKSVEEARAILDLTNKKAAGIMRKVLDSAAANAEHNHDLDKDALVITRIMVDDGIKFRRYRIVSRGRVHGYVRRRCHILVELSERK